MPVPLFLQVLLERVLLLEVRWMPSLLFLQVLLEMVLYEPHSR